MISVSLDVGSESAKHGNADVRFSVTESLEIKIEIKPYQEDYPDNKIHSVEIGFDQLVEILIFLEKTGSSYENLLEKIRNSPNPFRHPKVGGEQ